jgi:hypothetical protein
VVEKRIAGKAAEIVVGQSIARRWREAHTGGYRALPAGTQRCRCGSAAGSARRQPQILRLS